MTATAGLPFNTNAGRIPQAAAGRPRGESQGAAEDGQDSFANVLAETQASETSQAGAAPAASSETTQQSSIATATDDAETTPVESNAEGVAADTSQVVPVVAAQLTAVTVTTFAAPNLAGTALVADAEAGDAATPEGEGVEGAALVPGATPAVGALTGAAASTTAGPTAAATTAAIVGTAEINASAALEAATGEGSDAALEGEGETTTAASNSQSPSKASASATVASPAGSANPNAAATAATAAAPDLQAAAADPAAGQTKAAATVDALAAAAPAPHEAARASATHTAAQAAAPAATVQVYTRMIERFDGRAQRFEIRLDPAELGRVDVRIEIGADKKVHAVLAAHDSAALNDLMRGHRALERALADAGIDLADGGVKFELAGDTNRNASNGDGESRSPTTPNVWRSFELTNPSAEAAVKPVAQPWRQSRLDLVA